VLSSCPVQPVLGFVHALPTDTRPELLQEWERLFHHDWQFGKAVYEPRSTEKRTGNLTWLREEAEWRRREEFQKSVESGAAREQHLAMIAAMAERA
jgi:hypothetical protein